MKWFFYISFFLFVSCRPELPNKGELTDLYYSTKVETLLSEKDEACQRRAIAVAKEHVDSLIAMKFNADILDTIKFPPKPVRPKAPEHIIDKVGKFEIDTLGQ